MPRQWALLGFAAIVSVTLLACTRSEAPAAKPTEALPTAVAVKPQAPTPAPTQPQPPPTVAPSPAAEKPAAAAPAAQRLRVTGAGAEGVNMRAEPSTTASRVKLLRDGAELELAGEDRQADGRTWRNVTDPSDGATGWIAADFVVAADSPPAPVAPGVALPPAAKPAVAAPTAAPKPASGTTCGAFASQAAAQAAYRANPTGLRGLDGNDRDGIACEGNPPPYDRIPVPR